MSAYIVKRCRDDAMTSEAWWAYREVGASWQFPAVSTENNRIMLYININIRYTMLVIHSGSSAWMTSVSMWKPALISLQVNGTVSSRVQEEQQHAYIGCYFSTTTTHSNVVTITIKWITGLTHSINLWNYDLISYFIHSGARNYGTFR